MPIQFFPAIRPQRVAWNKGRIVGQKRPLQPKQVWSIRVRLEVADNPRDLALFNMAIDSKLRGCDLLRERASITQRKTGRPVRFEITEPTRQSLERWIANPEMVGAEFLWPSRFHDSPHLSTRSVPESCVAGSRPSVLCRAPTARIRCAGRRSLRSIGKQATCARSSCCSATPKWTARSATSVSSSMMR